MKTRSGLTQFMHLVASTGIILALYGCGAVNHKLTLKDNYTPQTGTTIEVGKVTNTTGQTFEVNVEELLRAARAEKLRTEGMLLTKGGANNIVLTSNIVEYDEGNAFKRWLLPGWGATVLSVQCDLKEGSQLVGSVEARRTVSVGGAYTIGAWSTIFTSLAGDIVEDLQGKFPKVSTEKSTELQGQKP